MNSFLLRARFGSFKIDEGQARLSRDGAGIELAPRAFAVLCELLRRPGQLVPEDALLDRVWGHRHVSESVVRTVVSLLRQVLGDDPRRPRYIETASRRGYRFIMEVILDEAAPPLVVAQPGSPRQPLERAGAEPSRDDRPPLVGRSAAMARLQTAWTRAQGGSRQLVLVGGEPGIGKSRLVEHMLTGLPQEVGVGFGQCVEHSGPAEPYMPILEALAGLCRSTSGTRVMAMLRRAAPSWLSQLPWLLEEEERRAVRTEAAGATQDRMLRELGELFDRACEGTPLVLVLEDLHWSDVATVHALNYLARRRSPARLFIIGTYRPTELIVQQHPLASQRHDLKLHGLCEDLTLEPLSEQDLGDWLAHRLGARPPEHFVHRLHAQTTGLPLYAAHMVDEWKQAGLLTHSQAGWRLPDPASSVLPRSIAHVIERHLERLPPDDQRLLCAASVAGVEFSGLCLAQVLERDDDAVLQALDRLEERLPWLRTTDVRSRADGRLDALHAFRHELFRHAIQQRIPVAQAVGWHRAWAHALQSLHEGDAADIAAALAVHLERGRDYAAAAQRLVHVAARAIERGVPREAVRAAQHGLELLGRAPDRRCEQALRVLEAVALTRLHVVSEAEVADAFARTTALDDIDSPERLRAAHGRWWVRFSRGEFDAARRLANDMRVQAERSGEPTHLVMGLCTTGMTLAMCGELDPARTALHTALELQARPHARASDEPFVQQLAVEAGGMMSQVAWIAGDFAAARAHAARAVDLAVESKNPLNEVVALYLGAAVHAWAGEFGIVESMVARLHEVIERHALANTPTGFDWLYGRALVARGAIDEGLAQMQRAAEGARRCTLTVTYDSFHCHYAEACRLAGRLDEAEASARQGLALADSSGARLLESTLWRQLALARQAQGDAAGASSAGRRAVEVARAQGATFHEVLALADAELGRWEGRDRARLAALLVECAGEPGPWLAGARAAL
jgi:DNA-binding winged helix-turn-helix (wHTH) protein